MAGCGAVRDECISAITLATRDMARAVAFYQALGLRLRHGGPTARFTTFRLGASALNLMPAGDREWRGWWGRVILHVADVDDAYRRATAAGLTPAFAPRDAQWGERYFHIADPDGHEISFATPLAPGNGG